MYCQPAKIIIIAARKSTTLKKVFKTFVNIAQISVNPPAVPGGTVTVTAVSYTHLDVYKRQIWNASRFVISNLNDYDGKKPTLNVKDKKTLIAFKLSLIHILLCILHIGSNLNPFNK